MNGDLLWIGILRGAYYVPVALAFALVARHGRYLPLWLPECGMVSAYLTYVLVERGGLNLVLAALLACMAGAALAFVAHSSLFAVYTRKNDPFKALLRGIGVIVILENLVAILTGGYSLAFSLSGSSAVSGISSGRFHLDQDTVVLLGSLVLTCVMWFLVNRTRIGLDYRAVSSNRDLAGEYGLPVRRIDLLVILLGGGLAALSGVLDGVRYGLTTDMMMGSALKVVAMVVAVGPDRLPAIAAGMFAIGIVESWCQASPRWAPFEHGVSYAVLAASLVIRYVAAPAIQRVWDERTAETKQIPEAAS